MIDADWLEAVRRRVRAVLAPESTIDLDEHAEMIVAVVIAARTRAEAAAPPVEIAAGAPA